MQAPRSNNLTLESAVGLFRQFVNHPQLTWDHNNTGCESRADLMAEFAVELGLTPVKIWLEITPGADGNLGIYLNESCTEFTFCKYHVAVVLEVEGKDLVFDPAFFDAPVNREAWEEKLSTYCREHCYRHHVVDSDWRNFYGPVQMIYRREGALEKRDELLELARDLDDPTVFSGVMAKARGAWVDELRINDPDGFERILHAGYGSPFGLWFKFADKNNELEQWLRDSPLYYGMPSEDVIGSIDFSDRLAGLEVRKRYWRYIHELFSLLSCKRDELLNDDGSGSSHESALALRFKLFWGDEAEERAEAREEWYGAASHELWDSFGVDYSAL